MLNNHASACHKINTKECALLKTMTFFKILLYHCDACMHVCLSVCLPVCLSVCLSVCVCLSVSVCMHACTYVRTSIHFLVLVTDCPYFGLRSSSRTACLNAPYLGGNRSHCASLNVLMRILWVIQSANNLVVQAIWLKGLSNSTDSRALTISSSYHHHIHPKPPAILLLHHNPTKNEVMAMPFLLPLKMIQYCLY